MSLSAVGKAASGCFVDDGSGPILILSGVADAARHLFAGDMTGEGECT